MPAVIYGHEKTPIHLSVDPKQVTELLHQHAHMVEVIIDTTTEPCLLKDVQWDHLGANILHIDLIRVDLTEQVTLNVELELAGEPIGLKEAGAFLQHPINEIEVRCLASQIPDRIKADISHLKAGETFTVGDLQLPAGVTAATAADTMIAAIQAVGEAEEAETTEGEATNEPQIIGK
jgi:large subunit ribosomal protein L25